MDKQIGYALAMRVLQSDLYAKLDDEERGECDALIRAGVGEPRQGGEPSGLVAAVPAWSRSEVQEDPEVLALCLRYGFGAVMQSASRQWRARDPIGAKSVGECYGVLKASPPAEAPEADPGCPHGYMDRMRCPRCTDWLAPEADGRGAR